MSLDYRLAALAALLLSLLTQELRFAEARDDVGSATCSTERRDGKDQDGNKVNCLFDACVQLKCDVSGSQITNCIKETTYSNPRDCKAASRRPATKDMNPADNGVLDTGPRNPRKPRPEAGPKAEDVLE